MAAYFPVLRWTGLLFDGVVLALCVWDLRVLRAASRVSAERQVEENSPSARPSRCAWR